MMMPIANEYNCEGYAPGDDNDDYIDVDDNVDNEYNAELIRTAT